MNLFSTVKNEDGTFTLTYTRIAQDTNFKDVEIIAEQRIYTQAEIDEQVQSATKRVADFQQSLANFQTEKQEIDRVAQEAVAVREAPMSEAL
jgi:hypothetical protein